MLGLALHAPRPGRCLHLQACAEPRLQLKRSVPQLNQPIQCLSNLQHDPPRDSTSGTQVAALLHPIYPPAQPLSRQLGMHSEPLLQRPAQQQSGPHFLAVKGRLPPQTPNELLLLQERPMHPSALAGFFASVPNYNYNEDHDTSELELLFSLRQTSIARLIDGKRGVFRLLFLILCLKFHVLF
jgi:hypothetical protein